jgi:four helix bundle protein
MARQVHGIGAMSDLSDQLKARTMQFALDVCALIRQLPAEEPGPTARRQLAKSSTGLAFNYRASCRARSHAEFTAKTGVVVEEADESLGWLEFIAAARLISPDALTRLIPEAEELLRIFASSYGTARRTERNR